MVSHPWRVVDFASAGAGCEIGARVRGQFEACLSLSWSLSDMAALDAFTEFVVEMVIDHEGHNRKDTDQPLHPPEGAMVKKVSMGRDLAANIQSMPTGRHFLVAIVGRLRSGQERRSPWICAATLSPDTREFVSRSVDPMNIPRANCGCCPCPGYVPAFSANSLNSSADVLCRHCGCRCTSHVAVQVKEILAKREKMLCEKLGRTGALPLPDEALEWDTRECALWFWTDGLLHPRQTAGEHRKAAEGPGAPGGPEGPSGRKANHRLQAQIPQGSLEVL